MPVDARRLVIAFPLLLFPATSLAQTDGHGPDAWQVTGVRADDVLNVRTGPGAEYMATGAFPPDATGLKMITCVPYLTREQHGALTDAQRADLPARWCLMEGAEGRVSGWVSARFLAEDTSGAQAEMDPLIDEAVALVRRLYDRRLSVQSDSAIGPLHPSVARNYFFADVVARLAQGVGADPLFGTQDAEIEGLEIRPAPERAMFRGMITVQARFRNFGQPQTVTFRLRVDPALDPPALRIMRIEHSGGTFP